MVYVEEYDNVRKRVEEIVSKERANVSFGAIKKPTLIEEIFSFDFSFIDTLELKTLEKYMGALSQYLIFYKKYMNEVNLMFISAQKEYNYSVEKESLKQDPKIRTHKEKELVAVNNSEDLQKLRQKVDDLELRILYHKDHAEYIDKMCQAIKKIYGERINDFKKPTMD